VGVGDYETIIDKSGLTKKPHTNLFLKAFLLKDEVRTKLKFWEEELRTNIEKIVKDYVFLA
jgi:hypothetical protein